MATYFLFGTYEPSSMKEISFRRSEEAISLVRKLGGEVRAAHAVLGQFDLVLTLELPDVQRAIQASTGLSRLLGAYFETTPAVTAQEFDRLIEAIPEPVEGP